MKLIKRYLHLKSALWLVIVAIVVGTGFNLLSSEPVELPDESAFLESLTLKNQLEEAEAEKDEETEEIEQEPEPKPEPQPQPQINIINCTDCTLAPVDKLNALPSTYNPGGLTSSTQTALNSMIAAAKTDGISMVVLSGFRSYFTQQSTFNYWVSVELNKGKTQAQAETDANTYSARPGHSEHQLGTTVDLKCATCADFDAIQNAEVYDFIEKNAHKYGFAVSYPRNSEALTGYTHEPWHVRWIGVDLATELFNTGYLSGNGNYLTKFLQDLQT